MHLVLQVQKHDQPLQRVQELLSPFLRGSAPSAAGADAPAGLRQLPLGWLLRIADSRALLDSLPHSQQRLDG